MADLCWFYPHFSARLSPIIIFMVLYYLFYKKKEEERYSMYFESKGGIYGKG